MTRNAARFRNPPMRIRLLKLYPAEQLIVTCVTQIGVADEGVRREMIQHKLSAKDCVLCVLSQRFFFCSGGFQQRGFDGG